MFLLFQLFQVKMSRFQIVENYFSMRSCIDTHKFQHNLIVSLSVRFVIIKYYFVKKQILHSVHTYQKQQNEETECGKEPA
jgi:hypothetical protein